MKYYSVTFIMGIVTLSIYCMAQTEYCGCKNTRLCYKKMLNDLLVDDEDPCVENANIGGSTITVFLQALRKYCYWCMYFDDSRTTFEGRNLYEVIINSTTLNDKDPDKIPVVVIDAGQDGGAGPVALALYIIEQLVACGENKEMIRNVKWVILPSTNPDGLEFSQPEKHWQKNFSPSKNISSGVDITRNFNVAWDICPKNDNIFSQNYPGPKASSEKETNFIEDVLKKYKNNIKTYISLRRDGHAILYPYASSNYSLMSMDKVKKRANDVAAKVNQRAGGIQWFVNESIYNMNGKPYCGHSVEYAINNLNIPFAYEMRVFAESSNNIMSKFYSLPKGQEASLRAGYFSGIRELYKSIINEIKQKPKK